MGRLFENDIIDLFMRKSRYLGNNGIMYPAEYYDYSRMMKSVPAPVSFDDPKSIFNSICSKEFHEHLEDNDIPISGVCVFFVRSRDGIHFRYYSSRDESYMTPPLRPDMASRMEAYRKTCDDILIGRKIRSAIDYRKIRTEEFIRRSISEDG